MWTKENRRRYDRSELRYESDLTDDERAEIASRIPPAKPGGNKRSVDMREVVNGLMYILSIGCQRRAVLHGSGGLQHSVRLLRPLELGWNATTHPSRPLC